MRAFTPVSLGALCALGLSVTKTASARMIPFDGYARTEELSVPLTDPHSHGHSVPGPGIPKLLLFIGESTPAEDSFDERRRREDDVESFFDLALDAEGRADPQVRSADADADTDAPDTSNPGDEQDFSSNPTPISEGRRRAGVLGILGTITATTALGYAAYTHRERVKNVASGVVQHLPSLERLKYSNISSSLPSLSLSTLSMPTLSLSGAPKRARKYRRLRRNKTGFRPPRNRGWTDAENGLLYDYDYDGDYERAAHSGSSSSSSSDPYEAEAFDLGADEDFMIGAGAQRRHSASISSPTTPKSKLGRGLGMGMGMDKVWGRWKRTSTGRSGRKGRRSASGSALNVGGNGFTSNGGGTVLFAVGNGEDVDLDGEDDIDLETNEALPLAPIPHRFGQGLGGLKGYGSAG